MDDLSTVARPYAQAAIKQAQDEGELGAWSEMLAFLAGAVADPALAGIIANPRVDAEQLSEVMLTIGEGWLSGTGANFVKLLVANARLNALAQIARQFELAKAQIEGRRQVDVISARKLTKKPYEQLAKAIARRLGHEVELNVSEDKALLGGVIIRAGDLVIDASIRGRLAQLGNALGAAA
ncbi:MAG: F0F1 ATP synthase subunit delta [Gammaproteobacteria bacterium]|nr:F0F1 ATP synthase subunit delta [Gammaproteobacteria bacterium]